jgi:hypothetical protein
MKDAESEEGGSYVGPDVGGPKPSQSLRELLPFEEVREVKDNIGDESSFYQSKKRPSGIEATSSSEMRLGASNYTPSDHLNGDPTVNIVLRIAIPVIWA